MLSDLIVRPVTATEEDRFQALMQAHHYLGALPKIGHTLWYVASWNGQWLALLSFSAPAWKCAARDRWIGWDFRLQYDRLHLIANNARFRYSYAKIPKVLEIQNLGMGRSEVFGEGGRGYLALEREAGGAWATAFASACPHTAGATER